MLFAVEFIDPSTAFGSGSSGIILRYQATATPMLTVNSSADSGDVNPGDGVCVDGSGNCTLRAAIEEANALTGANTIGFNISSTDPGYISSTDSWLIRPTSTLPTVTGPVIIDGYSQPGSVEATSSTAAMLKIELDGSSAGIPDGLLITAGSSLVKGLVINDFGIGIRLTANGGNVVQGNHIGTDITGTASRGNGTGVDISSPNNTVGGSTVSARNVISGNSKDGIRINDATGNLVQGNYIGTDATGSLDLGNLNYGIWVFGDSPNNVIGGSTTGTRNVISGNANGIVIMGNTSSNNLVQGNYVGTDANGSVDIGNSGDGVLIFGAPNNVVGGTATGTRNVISGNDAAGIKITGSTSTGNLVQGNFIGTDTSGTALLGNSNQGVLIEDFASSNTIGGTRTIDLNPNPPKDTDGRREESGRGVRELQGK